MMSKSIPFDKLAGLLGVQFYIVTLECGMTSL